MNAFHSNERSKRGQAAVEMALVAPILILVLLAVVDVGRAMYFYIGVVEAARAGAQYGAQSLATAPDTKGMVAAATNDAPQGITMDKPTATETCVCADGTKLKCADPSASPPTGMTTTGGGVIPGTCDPRVYVQVQTSATFNTLFHYFVIPSSFRLAGNSQMRAL